ncbi:unnamed protein product, partial [Staurois parvus]
NIKRSAILKHKYSAKGVFTSKRRQQAGTISIGQVGTGGASGDGSGSQGQVQQVASSVVQRVRQRDGQERAGDQSRRSQQRFRSGRVSKGTETGCRTDAGQIQGPEQTQHQGRVCKSGH